MRHENYFGTHYFSKSCSSRLFLLNLGPQDKNENGDRDNLARIFKNEMVYWDKQPFANLKGRMVNMINVTFVGFNYDFCSKLRIIATEASASKKNDGVPGTCRPPGGVPIPPPGTICKCLNCIPKKFSKIKISDWVYVQQQ